MLNYWLFIGSELIFIVLKLSMDCQRKRILDRHGEVSKELLDIYVKAAQIHEPAGADEENTFSLEITENDSRQDVLQRVLDIGRYFGGSSFFLIKSSSATQ